VNLTPIRFVALAVLAAAGFGSTALSAAKDAGGVEFFESRIRPLFIENCYECHSATGGKVKGGLRLDTREGVLKGGASGPVLVPGKPEQSRLIRAVRYADKNLQMPPKNKRLTPPQVADLEAWVRMGAPDPRTGDALAAANHPPLSDPAKVKSHWAFQPVKDPAVPKVQSPKSKVQNPIDAFVLAKLESRKLAPSPQADARTLIRRLCFDLTGLPPTAAEVEEFVRESDGTNRSTTTYESLVDRLLASPRYGERWARHWLDVARYADTKGYLAGDEQRRYAYSYAYRDWVIRAFNEDLPWDQFIIRQLAADLALAESKPPPPPPTPPALSQRDLAALGFVTLGRRFLNNQQDIIDDRLDAMCRGFMGLTVACARCHDHKYDPIPAKDYYSLYGVFASCSEPEEKPLLGIEPPEEDRKAYLAEREKREKELDDFRDKELAKALAEVRRRSGDYLLAAHELKGSLGRGDRAVSERKLDENTLRRWQSWLAHAAKSNDPRFAPWFAFAALPGAEFGDKAKGLATKFAANSEPAKPVHPLVAKMFTGSAPASLKEIADRYGKLLNECDSATPQSDPSREQLREVLRANGAPANVPAPENDSLLEGVRPRLRQMRAKVEEVDATHSGAPPRAMALQDNGSPFNPYVFVRGQQGNRGPEVPRQFLEVAAGAGRKPFTQGSGRLEMARAIADAKNPLTARVTVNRIWTWHFGQGLVRTPSDFGVRADPPSHPELLDWLATRFVESGWSVRTLHKLIVMSATYRQAGNDRPDALAADPNNLLLWKFNRQRLDFEQMRDALLAVAGALDTRMGGQPVDLVKEPFTTRRSVYGFIDRQNLPGMFRTFDFASPDTTSPQRFYTTVPQQALFMMNSPFVVQQGKALVSRADFKAHATDEARLHFLFQVCLQRAPVAEESGWALGFVAAQGSPGRSDGGASSGNLTPWERLAQALLLSNETMFVD
jgi:mono/diheme cytochrome c family protein